MELSLSELYLLIWAVLATVYAGYINIKMKEQGTYSSFMLLIMSKSLQDIAEGKAKAKMKNGQLIIEPCIERETEA